MNLDLTNQTVVKNNLELLGVVLTPSPCTSQQLVQPNFIHGILAQDQARVGHYLFCFCIHRFLALS